MIDDQFEVDENNVLIKYHEKEGITEVVIPDGVTKIGGKAFMDCINLTSIIMPNSVMEVGEYSFVWCKGLKNITIPNSVTKVGEGTFNHCTNLASITIPNSVTNIGNFAFSNCENLENIKIPNSVISMGKGVFAECTNLKTMVLPESITKIEPYTFAYCTNLTSITIPDSIEKIESCALNLRYIKDINIYSYKTFSILDSKSKQIAIISAIKNYYTGKIKYREEDMKYFKEYIKENKMEIFEHIKENKEIIQVILFQMGNFLTLDDIDELVSQNYDVEINAMLIEYSGKIRNEKINSLDEYDLGNFEDTNKGNII